MGSLSGRFPPPKNRMLICLNTRYQRKTWTRTPRHTLRLRLAGSQAAAACHEQIIIGIMVCCPSSKITEQIARLDGECLRQLDDVLQGDVPFAALNSADVVPMQSGALGQFLLGIAPLFAELPQPRAKSRLNGVWGHISMLGG